MNKAPVVKKPKGEPKVWTATALRQYTTITPRDMQEAAQLWQAHATGLRPLLAGVGQKEGNRAAA